MSAIGDKRAPCKYYLGHSPHMPLFLWECFVFVVRGWFFFFLKKLMRLQQTFSEMCVTSYFSLCSYPFGVWGGVLPLSHAPFRFGCDSCLESRLACMAPRSSVKVIASLFPYSSHATLLSSLDTNHISMYLCSQRLPLQSWVQHGWDVDVGTLDGVF